MDILWRLKTYSGVYVHIPEEDTATGLTVAEVTSLQIFGRAWNYVFPVLT